ncbi:MAG: beta-ketoacyl synthase N-terminal-like domain-containing protein [Bacteroidetes bacterium]|nr:beta-ketoacyl synthase N-terminal-like domain-containing protein [Bacteroidota bacterium]
MKNIYINGLGNISPQKTFDNGHFLNELTNLETKQLRCADPNYKEYISGDLVRRMSRIIKMGIAASKICLQDAAVEMPDAIITGTGLGCIEDTEKFLSNMIRNNEEFLTPTPFIQSTHNTVGAQIALLLKCHNYNFTYVNRGISFESALTDAMIRLKLGDSRNVLVGGMDELTANSFTIMERLGHWKRKPVNNLDLFSDTTRGSIAGEGAAFFLLSQEKNIHSYAWLHGLDTFYKPQDNGEIEARITSFLQQAGTPIKELDLVILGLNGDPVQDKPYHDLSSGLLKNIQKGFFKHLCGEYLTATAFALWLSCRIMKEQHIPEVVSSQGSSQKPVKNILVYNHYRNIDHSLMLISKV